MPSAIHDALATIDALDDQIYAAETISDSAWLDLALSPSDAKHLLAAHNAMLTCAARAQAPTPEGKEGVGHPA